MSRTRRRPPGPLASFLGLALVVLVIATLCRGYPELARVDHAQGAAPVESATREPSILELARAHAPLYRFNAYAPDDWSPHNASEDNFPQAVDHYFSELASGRARIVTERSRGRVVGRNAVLPIAEPVTVDADCVHGAGWGMAGDEPGTAPVYFHAFVDPKHSSRAKDGSGHDQLVIEYWLFYPQDECHVHATLVTVHLGGHRGDWEHTSAVLDVARGPGGRFLSCQLVAGIFSQHADQASCGPDVFELDDDEGKASALGEHMVVYVSLGKHASYPEPGVWHDLHGVPGLGGFDEFFLGNGFAWSSWKSPLLDLEGAPEPFACPDFLRLRSPSVKATDWRDYAGRYGPDDGSLASSPEGPRQHGSYGAGLSTTVDWSIVKRRARGLRLGRAAVVPEPLPTRE